MIKGENFLPETSLLVRLRTKPTDVFKMREVYRWDTSKVFFIDRQTLTVVLPEMNKLNLEHSCRELVFEVSLNNGAEWTTQEDSATYVFKPAPQILRYSHSYSDERGNFWVDVFGF